MPTNHGVVYGLALLAMTAGACSRQSMPPGLRMIPADSQFSGFLSDYGRLKPNPEFENPANWITIPMTDSGGSLVETAGDGVFTAFIPGQPHRTLVRYRITAHPR